MRGLTVIVFGLVEPDVSVANLGLFALLVFLEATAVLAVLRPKTYRHSLGRALICAGLGGVALWYAAQDTEGAPIYVFIHQGWLIAVILGCVILAIAAAVTAIRER
ncbi:MAG: hypothetical protein ACREVZ_00800 [Burkholderiales bacterium]